MTTHSHKVADEKPKAKPPDPDPVLTHTCLPAPPAMVAMGYTIVVAVEHSRSPVAAFASEDDAVSWCNAQNGIVEPKRAGSLPETPNKPGDVGKPGPGPGKPGPGEKLAGVEQSLTPTQAATAAVSKADVKVEASHSPAPATPPAPAPATPPAPPKPR